ncbi:ABC transporter permease [Heliobacterium gestii]|uniref:ABC transporter permease n=1 Tax=Heliomicrobium gestii TaxID=2699 RepID=A0A845LI64_HELGE|nr:ABC transporter permease [Heliomicrobium gestii]MBM7867712.1 ABC-2 type transport system permease protein [Heliomicrobium gestii]MZP44105.1 ABC transporter permease [Heliomicrobium gestii]
MQLAQQILLMAAKEFTHILRDRRTVFLILLAPLITFGLFAYLYDGQRVTEMNLVIVDDDRSPLSREIINMYGQSELFRYQGLVNTTEEAEQRIQTGETDVAVIIPENLNRDVKEGKSTQVLTLIDGTNMLISNGATKGTSTVLQTVSAGVTLRMMEANGIVPAKAKAMLQPINATIRVGYNPAYNYRVFLLFGLVATVLQQVMLTTMSGAFCREKERGTNMILVASRMPVTAVVLGKALPYFVICLFNCFLMLVLANQLTEISILGAGFDLFMISLAFTVSLVGIALIVSNLVPDELRANQIILLIATPSFLVSGFTWPLSKMPAPLVAFSNCLPLTHYLAAFRIVGVKGAPLSAVGYQLLVLFLLGVAGILGSMMLWRRQRETGKLVNLE